RLVLGRRAHAAEIPGRLVDIADRDRPPFRRVAFEEMRAAPAVDTRIELPGQIDGILNAHIHAEAAGRRRQMRGIAGNEDAAFAEIVGDQRTPHPGQYTENLVIEIEASSAADHGADFGFGMGLLLRAADNRQPPIVAAIDRDDRRPGAFRPDEDVTIGFALVVHLHEIGTAENNIRRIGEDALARHRDAETFAHCAGAAVAADEIARADRRALAAVDILDLGGDAIRILREAGELGAIAQLDA